MGPHPSTQHKTPPPPTSSTAPYRYDILKRVVIIAWGGWSAVTGHIAAYAWPRCSSQDECALDTGLDLDQLCPVTHSCECHFRLTIRSVNALLLSSSSPPVLMFAKCERWPRVCQTLVGPRWRRGPQADRGHPARYRPREERTEEIQVLSLSFLPQLGL